MHMCPPPPQHTQFGIDTTHNIQCQGWGGWGKRPTTSTAQTPPECRAISPPPPRFPCCGLGCGATLLVVLKVREGIHYLFAGVLLFFEFVDFRIELRSAYTVTPRGRCVTPSLLPAMCVCGVGLSSVQVPPSHHRSSLDNPTPQTHMAGRREGVTHLSLGVTVYALVNSILKSTNSKNKSTPAKR